MKNLTRIVAFGLALFASSANAAPKPQALVPTPKATAASAPPAHTARPGIQLPPALPSKTVTVAKPDRAKPVQHARPHKKRRVQVRRSSRAENPAIRIMRANDTARVQPASDGFINAVQSYAYSDGALYQVYATPGHITDIILQDGEQLAGTGPVAAGDTTRWVIGATTSGSGPGARVHIMVKPTRSDLATNLIINTNRRTYHLELKSSASIWMASLSWNYPQDGMIAIEAQAQAALERAPVASGIDATALRFNYEIQGDKPDWRPLRAFDDGRQTFIAFPASIAEGAMPPLFMTGVGGDLELVNYRVRGPWMIVDRLFERAELRLGSGKQAQVVQITRVSGKHGK
jgi:type IV secretion system protein VirB9